MKIVITESQYKNLIIEQQTEIEFPNEITVRFTNFNPDTKNQKSFVYINGMSKEDAEKIKEMKDANSNSTIKLSNVLTKEAFDFTVDKINFTKAGGAPYIFDTEYNKIKKTLETHEIKLDENFLKKQSSGFPDFMLDVLFKLYPSNIGKNRFTDSEGICNSEDGLIDIPNTNVPGQSWSILNYFDTNPMVIKKLIEWYTRGVFNNMESPEGISIKSFQQWISDNDEGLFKPGKYMEELVELNLKSYESGTKTENLAIKKLTESPYNIDPKNIKQFCSGSKQDRYDGKDLEITTESGESYAQVKPLSWYKVDESTKEYVVNSYQMKNYKSKPIQYLIFAGAKGLLIFDNKNYRVENNHFAIFKNPPLTNLR